MRQLLRTSLTFQVTLLVLLPAAGSAAPLERFEAPLELECAHDSTCTKTVRSKVVLGGTTGIVLTGGNEGRAKLAFRQEGQRRLELSGKGESVHSLALVWDGDSNPETLSAAGLGCFDLTSSGGTAFVLRDLAVAAECAEPSEVGECQPLEIETRIYDAGDPTGQRFSASVIRRPAPRAADELLIPFSNLSREGPHGLARPTCAGAVTITFRLSGFKDVRFSVGPIYTNGTEGLTYLPSPTPSPSATPTSTPSATPTVDPAAPVTDAVTSQPAATVLPTLAAGTPAAETPIAEGSPTPSAAALLFATPSALEVFEDEKLERVSIPQVPEVEPEEPQEAPGIVPERDDEVIYGGVISVPQE